LSASTQVDFFGRLFGLNVSNETRLYAGSAGLSIYDHIGTGRILNLTQSSTNVGVVGTGDVATFTSTGLNSTAIGATTPSTVAATSVNAKTGGTLQLSDSTNADYCYIQNTGTDTATQKMQFTSNGSGALAYSFNTYSGGVVNALTIAPSGNVAVTGALSASGASTLTGRVTTAGGFTATATVPTVVASSANFDYNSTGSNGRLIVWGPDVSTSGNLTINLARSDGSNFVTPVSVSSAGAAITGTLSATGQISTSATGNALNISTAGATALYQNIGNSAGNIELGAINTGEAYVASTGNKDLRFYRYGSLMASITSTGLAVTGTLSCTTGAAVGGASAGAGGLAFPATAVAVADANTLDDYEEGTWTPTDNSGAGLSLTVYSATYTKVGRLVEIEATIQLPSTASAASMQFAGLPFTAAGGDDNTGGLCITATDAGANNYFLITRGTTTFTVNTNVDASVQNVAYSTKKFKFFGYYHV
jgi:hypothetical protein